MRAKVPSARVSYLEPDCYRAGAQPGQSQPGRLTRVQPSPPVGSLTVLVVGC